MRILHLLWNEKVTPRIIKTFETVFPDQNDYIFWLHSAKEKKFFKEAKNCYSIDEKNIFPDIDYTLYDKVIIHGLDNKKIDLCENKILKNVPIFWLWWGTDIYNTLLFNKGYKLYYHPRPISKTGFIKKLLRHLGFEGKITRSILRFIKTREITALCYKQEYDLFRKYFPAATRNMKFQPGYFYYPIDEILGPELIHKRAKGNYILIGNSNSITNNHHYVFDIINNLNLKSKKIVVPLSYNGDDQHRISVITSGEKLFGNSFLPLTQFIPLNEYNEILTKAEVCLYGSWRQEAVGNIVISLYLGAKVFISKKSPLLEVFISQGLSVFPLESIDEKSIHEPLSKELKLKNRQIIINLNNWERLRELTFQIFG